MKQFAVMLVIMAFVTMQAVHTAEVKQLQQQITCHR